MLELSSDNRIVFLSDSLSGIKLLQDGVLPSTPRNMSVFNFDKGFVLEWVPGHVGIASNEQADEAAKDVTSMTVITPSPLTRIDGAW